MVLKQLIEWLEKQDQNMVIKDGFGSPHSDRGRYQGRPLAILSLAGKAGNTKCTSTQIAILVSTEHAAKKSRLRTLGCGF